MTDMFVVLGQVVDEPASVVREKICNYLVENRELMGRPAEVLVGLLTRLDLLSYVALLRDTKSRPGEVVLYAFCQLYRIQLSVRRTDRLLPPQKYECTSSARVKHATILCDGQRYMLEQKFAAPQEK